MERTSRRSTGPLQKAQRSRVCGPTASTHICPAAQCGCGPYNVKKSGHNGFSAVAEQGSYGKVFIASGEDSRLHAVKVFCGRDATAEAKHEVELYQSLQELRDCDRAWFPKLLASDCTGQPFPWMSMSFGGLTLAHCLRSGERFDSDTLFAITQQLQRALVVLHKYTLI